MIRIAIRIKEKNENYIPVGIYATAAFFICAVSLRLIRKKTYMISDFEHYNTI